MEVYYRKKVELRRRKEKKKRKNVRSDEPWIDLSGHGLEIGERDVRGSRNGRGMIAVEPVVVRLALRRELR